MIGTLGLFMFLKLKSSLEGSHFKSLQDIQSNVMTVLKEFLENDFRHSTDTEMYVCVKSETLATICFLQN